MSFEAFEPEGGPMLLIREVTEEQTGPPRRAQRPRLTIDEIRGLAAEKGVAEPFDRFLGLVGDAGLAVQPYRRGVMVAPPANRTRYLMYARPEQGSIVLHAGPAQFAEFFPPLMEEDAVAAIGSLKTGRAAYRAGDELDACLDQVEAFLGTLPRPSEDDGAGLE